MPTTSRRTKRTTKKRATKRKGARRTVHRQADVWNMEGPEAGMYPSGAYAPSGPSGYGFRSTMASMFQGRNQVSPYGTRSAAAAAPVEPVAASTAAASTSSDAVVQQRPVRLAMQRILRELK